jgi:thiol:disulfide interchange protein
VSEHAYNMGIKLMIRKACVLQLALVAVAILLTGCSASDNSSSINWLYDSQEALKQAQAENKPIMVNFYTDICPACRKLDQGAFSNEKVTDFLNKNFICLKSNTGKSSLYGIYGIQAVPTTLFSIPDGFRAEFEIGRIVGVATPDQFYDAAVQVISWWQSWDSS